jgi:hypothetical protein
MPEQAGPLQRVMAHPQKKIPRPSLIVRFMEKVDIQPGGCWLWTASVANEDGYGWFRHPDTHYAHRASYLMFVGPLAEGQVIDHLCGRPPCVNPDHLEATTTEVNIHRWRRGTPWKACDVNHPDTPTRLVRRKKARTLRCNECHRVNGQRSRQDRKAGAR